MLDLTRLVKFYLCAADLVCAIYRCELFLSPEISGLAAHF
ncbi:hypothetical protein CAMRE0001_2327 [Campylobacter rectus RM3267]|uniref:Uncharacterized protein n=1 Tax=Campylobacter rectus RM3267 TaxID=553218 RepID=B9D5G9_CAMRE|nr:hypothetical protein CAMRE0001_2327 [Campylobacter rectus RM3267]